MAVDSSFSENAASPHEGGELAIGSQVLRGRFLIERPLGRGAAGAVYAARDRERGELVALKVLLHPDGAGVFRIKQEFRSFADVVHPNLVRLYELFADEGRWFFTMELLTGSPLSHYLARGTTLAPHPRTWLSGLAAGIWAIHQAGELHRDLKPSNVMLEPDGRVVVLDFGVVAESGYYTGVPALVPQGTPAYLAPEIARNVPAGPPADWYSFGVILYEALWGRLPFDGSPAEVFTRKQQGPPSFPKLDQTTDAEFAQLCRRLLDPDPAARAGYDDIVSLLGKPEASARKSWLPQSDRGSHVFVGREQELDAILREFDLVRRGTPRVVLVPGDSGIGKTTLLHEACRRLLEHEKETRILKGRCYERENLPFKAWDGAIDTLCLDLASWQPSRLEAVLPEHAELLPLLFPVFGQWACFSRSQVTPLPTSELDLTDDLVTLRRTAFRALGNLLRTVARGAPVVLALDDLQWSDLDSVRLIVEIITQEDPPPLLLLGSYRTGSEISVPALRALLRGLDDRTIPRMTLPISALEQGEAERLIRDVLEGSLDETIRTIAIEAHGMPYFALQLAHRMRLGARAAELTLERTLQAQVADVGSTAREVLALIGSSPGPVPRSVLLRAMTDGVDLSMILSELRRERLIRSLEGADSRIDLYHERVREPVIAALPSADLVHCHSSLADAWLEEPSPDPATVLHHLKNAERLSEAGSFALLAAESAEQSLAFEHAAHCYEEVIHLLRPEGDQLSTLLTKWARALGACGRGPQAAEVYLRAASLTHPSRKAELRWRAAEQLFQSRGNATELLSDVLSMVGFQLPSESARTRRVMRQGLRDAILPSLKVPMQMTSAPNWAVCERFDRILAAGVGMMFGGDLDLCIYLLVEATQLGLSSGEPGRTAIACAMKLESELHTKGIDSEHARLQLELAESLLERTSDQKLRAYGYLLLGQTHYSAAHLPEASRLFEQAAARFSSLSGLSGLADEARTSLSFMYLMRGDARMAGSIGSELVALGDARGQPFFRKSGHVDLGTLRLAQDDPQATHEHIGRLVECNEDKESWFGAMALQMGAVLGAYDHRYRLPLELFDEGRSRFRSLSGRIHYRPWLEMGRSVALLDRLADRPEVGSKSRQKALQKVLKSARVLKQKTGVRVLNPFGVVFEAAVFHQKDRHNKNTLELLERAEKSFERSALAGYQNMVKRTRGILMGGALGNRLVSEADTALGLLGVVDPARLSAAHFPGLAKGPSPSRSFPESKS